MNASTNMVVPAHILARIAARSAGTAKSSGIAAAIVGGSGETYPRISIRAGRYRLVEGDVETPVGITLDVIVVGVNPNTSKTFYGKAYDQAAGAVAPDCSSRDGKTPDANIQNPVSASCATCPNNALGSKILPSGAQSKLCADQRNIAVVPAADPSKVYGMTIPVSGMKPLREYFKELQNFGAEPNEVVTELGFDDKASFPKITFARKGFVPEKALAKLEAILESDEVKECTRMIPATPRALALAAPAPAAQPKLAAVPTPAPVAEEEDAYEDAPAAAAPVSQPVAPSSKKNPPAVAAVAESDSLASKLDSLFGE